jgi:hypothetical protein
MFLFDFSGLSAVLYYLDMLLLLMEMVLSQNRGCYFFIEDLFFVELTVIESSLLLFFRGFFRC